MANTDIYHFKLGHFQCICISDGSMSYPVQSFFANAPREQAEAALRQRNLSVDYVTTPLTCLVVNTGARRVLMDTGAGDLTPDTGRLSQNMEAAGVMPEDIDTVIITHAHPDHIGGVLDDNGRPVYANAQYLISKDEWRFWTSDIAMSRAPERYVALARRNLGSIEGQLSIVDREFEAVPGVRMFTAPGHTPGHIAVSVSSGDEQLLYISDAVLHPLHLEHLGWISIYDIMPEEVAATRRRILDRAADEEALVLGTHFPFPSLCYIVRKGKEGGMTECNHLTVFRQEQEADSPTERERGCSLPKQHSTQVVSPKRRKAQC